MSLPLDSNDPAIRRALHLIRIQVLTPVSVLVNIATCIICALVINPSMKDISNMFPSTMTPKSTMIGLYWMVVFGMMVFYSLLIVIATKDETKVRAMCPYGFSHPHRNI
jgi:hypothetical protein